MKIPVTEISSRLKGVGLKLTPQRLAILDAIYNQLDHPTAERITDCVRKQHPTIATGTVYKVLDVLVENELIKKVKTDKDVMHFDGILENHHHLYCSQTDEIQDYMDDDLDGILKDYFKKKKIAGFKIDEIRLQINGKFLKSK